LHGRLRTLLKAVDAQQLGLVRLQGDEYRERFVDVRQITLADYMARWKKAAIKKERWECMKAYSKKFLIRMSRQSHSRAFGDDHGGDCASSCDCDGYNFTHVRNRPIVPIVYVDNEITQKKADTIVGSLQGIREMIDKGAPVKHVVLRVSSPGGEAPASKIIAAELERLPVPWTVSFGNTAASGKYLYCSVYCDEATTLVALVERRISLSRSLAHASIRPFHQSQEDI
jgi:hypothetical protein